MENKQSASFGGYLKTVRLEKGIKLSTISSQTRISRDTLEALEVGDHARLPAEVFVKGFIRAYARVVGADADVAVKDYLENRDTPEEARWSMPGESGVQSPRRIRPLIFLVIFFILTGTGVLIWRTLVPEKADEVTTEGGLDVIGQKDWLAQQIQTLQISEIPVSLFIDPDLGQVKKARKIDANCIEIHTGLYAAAKTPKQQQEELERIEQAAKLAKKFNMGVNAGHDLTYRNVTPIAAIEEIEELNIGHNIIARAVFVGLEQAIKEMLALVRKS